MARVRGMLFLLCHITVCN